MNPYKIIPNKIKFGLFWNKEIKSVLKSYTTLINFQVSTK